MEALLASIVVVAVGEIDDTAKVATSNLGAFALTAGAFFVAEMGDKTQIATAVLAAQFGNVAAVVTGTTLGMLIADVPVVRWERRRAPHSVQAGAHDRGRAVRADGSHRIGRTLAGLTG
jgi:putative Ca2+/H+ antiporter (TMEM165/GDT1 family)